MTRKLQYDLDAKWDDPFEKQEERRRAGRFLIDFKFDIRAPIHHKQGYMVGPGVVKDMSQSGLRLISKHTLWPSQEIKISIPTHMCSESMRLPSAFTGSARVVRVVPKEGKRKEASVRFSKSLSEDLEFAVFIESLMSLSTFISDFH